MEYLLTFLEGIITFISPCLLPMLPVYISYFAGHNSGSGRKRSLINALGFVMGFTLIFVLMGALAGTAGSFMRRNQTIVNLVTGIIVIFFGLNYLEVLNIPLLKRTMRISFSNYEPRFLHSVIFGMVFSVGWTPCVGVFLGSALMLAARSGESIKGIIMLLCFSIGLGIPFVVSAVLINRLKTSFEFIKRNYRIINTVSGLLLIVIGILMATGLMGKYISLLSAG